jgi:hypothetical protein
MMEQMLIKIKVIKVSAAMRTKQIGMVLRKVKRLLLVHKTTIV